MSVCPGRARDPPLQTILNAPISIGCIQNELVNCSKWTKVHGSTRRIVILLELRF